MSQKEFQRVKVIENAVGGRLSVREASRLLQPSERQVQRRLKRRYQPDSLAWVQHYQRVVGADHVVRLGDHLFALPALPGHRGYANQGGDKVSSQLIRHFLVATTESMPLGSGSVLI